MWLARHTFPVWDIIGREAVANVRKVGVALKTDEPFRKSEQQLREWRVNIGVVLATQITGGELAKMDLIKAVGTRNSVAWILRRTKGCNIHDLVWVIQLRKSNDEYQHGQHGDGDLAGTWGLRVPLDGTSVPLKTPCIQPPSVQSAGACTHRVVEVGGETLVLLVIIFTDGASFDCRRAYCVEGQGRRS